MDARDTEILVHVTAPSLAVNDREYRAFAQAYYDFEPTTRVFLSPKLLSSSSTQSSSIQDLERHIESPNLSFSSVLDNLPSPRLRLAGRGQQSQTDVGEGSWKPPPSTIADSQPGVDLRITSLCSPTRVLEYFIQQRTGEAESLHASSPTRSYAAVESIPSSFPEVPERTGTPQIHSDEPPTSSLPPANAVLIAATPEVSRPQISDPATDTSGFIVPATPYPVVNVPASPPLNREALENSKAGSFPLEVISCTSSEIISSFRSDSEPPSRKRRQTDDGATPLHRSSSDVGPRHKRRRTEHEGSVLQQSSDVAPRQLAPDHTRPAARIPISSDELEIFSPEPATALDFTDARSLITPPLSKIVDDMERWRYEPEVSREVQPFERGYWLIDTSDWDGPRHNKAWQFLSIKLRRGDVGWGTWCQRNREKTWLRVYCFGAVTAHMYFVLYVASHPAIKHQGATWYGGDGQPVIITKPRHGGRAE